MANITAALAPAMGYGGNPGRRMYMVQNEIDLTANSINPNGDTVQALTLPAGHLVVAAGFEVVTSATMNTGTDATAVLGFTGGDVDEFVAAFDIDGASDGDYAPQVAITGMTVSASDDTIDLLLAGSGSSFSAGKLRVYAMLMDVSNTGTSKQANEVDRDYLA